MKRKQGSDDGKPALGSGERGGFSGYLLAKRETLRLRERDARAMEGELVDRLLDLEARGVIKAGERRRRVTAWQNAIRRPGLCRCYGCGEFLIFTGRLCGKCGFDILDVPEAGHVDRQGVGSFAVKDGAEVQVVAHRGTPTWLAWAGELGRRILAGDIPPKATEPPLDEDDYSDEEIAEAVERVEQQIADEAERPALPAPERRPRRGWLQVHDGGKPRE